MILQGTEAPEHRTPNIGRATLLCSGAGAAGNYDTSQGAAEAPQLWFRLMSAQQPNRTPQRRQTNREHLCAD